MSISFGNCKCSEKLFIRKVYNDLYYFQKKAFVKLNILTSLNKEKTYVVYERLNHM